MKTKVAPAKTPAKKARNIAAPKDSKTANSDGKLEEFFKDEIKDIYWAEKLLVKTLPKMAKAAKSTELKDAFSSHLEQTKGHVERLEQVFELLDEKVQAKKCDAMEGITKEGAGIIEETENGSSSRDIGLILAGQKVEHYEIATYGGLAQLARNLGHDEVADLLEQTLEEEKSADQLLTNVAQEAVNYEEGEESDDEEN